MIEPLNLIGLTEGEAADLLRARGATYTAEIYTGPRAVPDPDSCRVVRAVQSDNSVLLTLCGFRTRIPGVEIPGNQGTGKEN